MVRVIYNIIKVIMLLCCYSSDGASIQGGRLTTFIRVA